MLDNPDIITTLVRGALIGGVAAAVAGIAYLATSLVATCRTADREDDADHHDGIGA